MSLILQIQEIVEGPIRDLYLELTGGPLLPPPPAPAPVDVQIGPEEVGDITSSFGDIAPTSSLGDIAPTSSFGDLGSSFGDLSSGNDLGSSFGDIGLNPSLT